MLSAVQPASAESQTRVLVEGSAPSVLTEIYEDPVNISVWQRQISPELSAAVSAFLAENPNFQKSMTIAGERSFESLKNELGTSKDAGLIEEDIAELVDMFCCLFELERAGLRLTVLDSAMCPRFHVDRVPCRLITTYAGAATEWLPHQKVDRSKLGHGNGGLPDNESGLYRNAEDINRLNPGDVALLKGESWEGNEGAGLVHRSPKISDSEPRLLLTLDFSM